MGRCAPSQIVLDNFSIKGNPSLSDHARLEIVQPGVKLCSLAYSGGPREMSEWVGTVELKRKKSKSGYYGVIPSGKRWQARLYNLQAGEEGLGPHRHVRHCARRCGGCG